jgi:RHS repeat-associated protein
LPGSWSFFLSAAHSGFAAYSYRPYGECLQSQGILGTDKRFTGQRLDNTGLYYYGARYYDPTIGRFISADTIVPNPANPQTLNRYAYCLNNPLKYTDPSGHMTFDEYYSGMMMYGVAPAETMRDTPATSTSTTIILTTITSADYTDGGVTYYNSAKIPDMETGLNGVYEPDDGIYNGTPKHLPPGNKEGVKLKVENIDGVNTVIVAGGLLQVVDYYGALFSPHATGNMDFFTVSQDYVRISITTSYNFQNQSTYCSVSVDGGFYLSINPGISFNGGSRSDMDTNGMNSYGRQYDYLASSMSISLKINYINPYNLIPCWVKPEGVMLNLP